MKSCFHYLKILLFLILLATLTTACKRKPDIDGGYYDEKTKRYKYVRPTRVDLRKIKLKVVPPQAGIIQKIDGTVSGIDDDAKSIWIKIAERKPYMILADSLASSNRDDKEKLIRINLEYVSPSGSVARDKKFKRQWKRYVINVLKEQLLNQPVIADIRYDERARKFWGTIYKVVTTKQGKKARNINLWMVHKGLSYYFVDHGKSVIEAEFIKAQRIASKSKSGIWQYQ